MTLHVDELSPPTTDQTTITTGPDNRLVVSRWDTSSGRSLVSIAPEFRDRRGVWHLAHSAVSIPPAEAAEVAAALLEVAAKIAGAPVDPTPTPEDRDESRWP